MRLHTQEHHHGGPVLVPDLVGGGWVGSRGRFGVEEGGVEAEGSRVIYGLVFDLLPAGPELSGAS